MDDSYAIVGIDQMPQVHIPFKARRELVHRAGSRDEVVDVSARPAWEEVAAMRGEEYVRI